MQPPHFFSLNACTLCCSTQPNSLGELPKFAQYNSLGTFFFLFKGRKFRMTRAFVIDPTRKLSKTNLRDDTTLDGLHDGDNTWTESMQILLWIELPKLREYWSMGCKSNIREGLALFIIFDTFFLWSSSIALYTHTWFLKGWRGRRGDFGKFFL